MCIADTSTARVAPKQRAARHEQAPAPALAVVAPAKRLDATEQDARCVRARDASPTRERHPDERDVGGRCVGLSRPATRWFIFRMRIFRIVPVSNVEPQTRVVNARVERVVGAACKQNTSSL